MYTADQARLSMQSNTRSGPIVRFIWHHQAGTNDDATIAAMVSGSRQVSATWTVSNTGRITSVIPEELRPWTSSSRSDDGALTVECANITGPPDYGISDESHEACAKLAAYAFKAYGVPLRRATKADATGHLGHNEVIGIFGDGYATACPMHLDIDRIIARAAEMVAATIVGSALASTPLASPTVSQEDDMPTTIIVKAGDPPLVIPLADGQFNVMRVAQGAANDQRLFLVIGPDLAHARPAAFRENPPQGVGVLAAGELQHNVIEQTDKVVRVDNSIDPNAGTVALTFWKAP